MWKLWLCLLVTCYVIEVKASSDISLENLLERLVVLEDWKRVTENEVASLKSTVAHQEITIQNLQKALTAQSNLTAEQKQYQQDKRQDISQDESTKIDIREKHTQTSGDSIRTTELQGNGNHETSKMIKRDIAGGIAFTVYLDHDVYPAPIKQIVKFNKIITNDGNAYNIHTGVFTCPKAGMYLFTFFVGERSESDTANQLWAELVVNSNILVGAAVETRHTYEDAQGGNTVVIRLNPGDAVWVDAKVFGYHVEASILRPTTFTGVYLYT